MARVCPATKRSFLVPLEGLVGIFAFLTRDSGVATGLSMLSAAWATTGITMLLGPPGARRQL